MKKIITLSLSLAAIMLSTMTMAEESWTQKYDGLIDGSINRQIYQSIYSNQASMLSSWEGKDYSFINAGYTFNEGEYYQPQLFSSVKGLSITTESIYTMPEKGWSFYGQVAYHNSERVAGEWNLECELPTNGSPFYYMVEKSGWWKTQTYDFDVAAAKQLNDKISLGIGLLYSGDMYYRMADTRNKNTNLEIEITPSISYKVSDKHTLGAGVLFDRKKNEQYIYNKYSHGTDGGYYITYINQGLGSWYKDSDNSQRNQIELIYGGTLSWNYRSDKDFVDVIYTAQYGREDWRYNYYSQNSTDGSSIVYYTHMDHQLSARYQHSSSYGRWVGILDAEMITGLGYIYSDASASYIQNYSTTLINADLSAQLLLNNKYVRRVELGASLSSADQLDNTYAHSVAYSNVLANVDVDFGVYNRGDIEFVFGVQGLYNMNLFADHNAMAATDNMYTTNILVPTLAYLTSSYCGAGAKIGVAFGVGSFGRALIDLSGQMVKPMAYNLYESSATFSLDDTYLNTDVVMSLYF